MLNKRFALPLLLGAAALPAAAFAASGTDSVTTVTGVGLAAPMNVNSLLPVVNNNSVGNFQAVIQMYRPLLWIGRDLKIDWTDSIAKSIKVSANRTVFTVTMKDWKWSDGKPVTAADAAYGFQMIKDFGKRYPNYGIGGMPGIVKSFKVLGEHTFRVTLTHSVNANWFKLNGLSQITPAPRFAWKAYSIDYLFNHQTDPALVQVVDGPYKLARFAQGREVAFVANPAYSGHQPSIKHFTFKMITSSDAAFAALKTGDIQIGNVPATLYNARRLVANLKSMRTSGGFSISYLPLNFTNPKVAFFHDLKVREALQYAIDQPLIIKTVLHGLGTPSFNPVPSAPDTYLSPEMKKLVAHPLDMYRPKKAAQLLDEAGWKPGPNGVREKDGKRLAFSMIVPSGNAARLATAQILKQEWQAIGVDMSIRQMTFNQEIAMLAPHKDWEMAMIGWVYAPDYYPSGGGMFNTGGGSNYGAYSNPKMDKLIAATTHGKGLKTLYAYENYAARQLPVLFLPAPGYLVKYDPRLHGMNKFYTPVSYMAPEYLSYAKSSGGAQ
ncbi:peptide ABC transporter substrate-binding protein [Acidihalobacter ferrooxydans]|uniref:Peptide ABC transporter substrate-binding protein n=2 Tax=Acidihalobacter ferrooxydans TaxID=1765967 RepID=A0A1P8ULN3_9GAMM|nr:peptide ABC transporter substrate-binding protein [Acidihalobacter ferrooxydans]